MKHKQKPVKVYSLFGYQNDPTCRSQVYGRVSKNIWHVAAKSVKQALWLCSNNQWHTGDKNAVGILEATSGNYTGEDWIDFAGNKYASQKYKHGKRL